MSQNDAANALDEVNLDDMFADGGGLFEGLDIDLDDNEMGEIMDGTPTGAGAAAAEDSEIIRKAPDLDPSSGIDEFFGDPTPPPPPLPPNRGNRPTLPPGSEDMDVKISSTSRSSLTKVRLKSNKDRDKSGQSEVRKSKRKRRAPSRPVDEYDEEYKIPPELLKDSIAAAAAGAPAGSSVGAPPPPTTTTTKHKKKKESSKKKKKGVSAPAAYAEETGPVSAAPLAADAEPATDGNKGSGSKSKSKRRRMLAPPSSGGQHRALPSAEDASLSSLSNTTGASSAAALARHQRGMPSAGPGLSAAVAVPEGGSKKKDHHHRRKSSKSGRSSGRGVLPTASCSPPRAPGLPQSLPSDRLQSKSSLSKVAMPPPPPRQHAHPSLPTSAQRSTSSGRRVGRGELPLHPSGAPSSFGAPLSPCSAAHHHHQLPLQAAAPHAPTAVPSSSAQQVVPPAQAGGQPAARRGSRRPSSAEPDHSEQQGCGIVPSRTLFYPYMPLPAAVILKRTHKSYPQIDRVSLRSVQHLPSGGEAEAEAEAEKKNAEGNITYERDHPLVRLFAEHLGAPPGCTSGSPLCDGNAASSSSVPPGADCATGKEDALAKLLTGLGSARGLCQTGGVGPLRREVRQVLDAVRKQSEFLATSASNMEKWCSDNFERDDYAHVYDSGDEGKKVSVPTADSDRGDEKEGDAKKKKGGRKEKAPSTAEAPAEVKAKLPAAPVTTKIKVRVKCHGFREPTTETTTKGGSEKRQQVQHLAAQFPVPPDAVERAAAATVKTAALREVLLASAARQMKAHALASAKARQRAAARARAAMAAGAETDGAAAAAATAEGSVAASQSGTSGKPKNRKSSAAADKVLAKAAVGGRDANDKAISPSPRSPPPPPPVTAALLLKPTVPYAAMSPADRLRWVAAAVALRAHSLRSGLDARARERAGAARARDEELARIAGLDEETLLLAEERAKMESMEHEKRSGSAEAGASSSAAAPSKPEEAKGGNGGQAKQKEKKQGQQQQPAPAAVPPPPPQHILNTVSLWEAMERSPFMADFDEEDAREVLQEAWQPEAASRRAVHWRGEPPTPRVASAVAGRKHSRNSSSVSCAERSDDAAVASGSGDDSPSSSSLFDRLQSLLVEEDDTDDESDRDPDEVKEGENKFAIFSLRDPASSPRSVALQDGPRGMVHHHDQCRNPPGSFVDVSALSLDQRTYLHLRAAGLIDTPVLPSEEPAVIDERDGEDANEYGRGGLGNSSSPSPVPPIDGNDDEEDEENDIDSVLHMMASDLSDAHHRTNAHAASLQSAAGRYLCERRRRKLDEERDAQLIAKHTQLVKKRGERKREEENAAAAAAAASRKEGQGKDGEGWMPW